MSQRIIPVSAVNEGGMPTIKSGSLIEICGVTRQSIIAILTLRSVSVIIQKRVISDAVPAVVLIAINGIMSLMDLSTPSKSLILPPLEAIRPMPLAQSCDDPPPRETMALQLF